LTNADVPFTYYKNDNDIDGFEVTKDLVNFNGKGDDSHETFYFKRVEDIKSHDEGTKIFNFCKTAYKPYDKYVTACLILAKCYFKDDILVSSDGELEDWQEGKALVENKLGHKIIINVNAEGRLEIKFEEMEKISSIEKELIFGKNA